MGIKKNADASYNLGLGVSDANDYKGFAGQNEITIQLTADGATDKSMDALNYLKTFAINQAAAGLPIKPSASVSISANGYTKALEADDFEITETGVKIGGIEYTASTDSWDFTNALVPSGGGGGGNIFVVNETHDDETGIATLDKTAAEIIDILNTGITVVISYVSEYQWSGQDSVTTRTGKTQITGHLHYVEVENASSETPVVVKDYYEIDVASGSNYYAINLSDYPTDVEP